MNSSITTVVGSPVLAATVGPGLNFVGLAEPVRILLRLNEELDLRVGSDSVCACVWSFDVTYESSVGVESVEVDFLDSDSFTKKDTSLTCRPIAVEAKHG